MYEYKEFWKNWNNINGYTNMDDYLKVWLFHILIPIVTLSVLVFGIDNLYRNIVMGYFVIAFIPIITMTIRRLNDNGVSRLNIFWVLLPIIGILIIITKMVYGPNDNIEYGKKAKFKNQRKDNVLTHGKIPVRRPTGFMRK